MPVLRQLFFLALIAIGVSVLLGLRFAIHLFPRFPDATPVESHDWYVVLVTLFIALIQRLPYWRYRDPLV